MIFKAPTGHEFVHEQPLIVFNTISDELHKVRMMKLPKKINLSLHWKESHHFPIQPHLVANNRLTTHSLWPWRPSGFKLLTATVVPEPGFAGAVPFSSIHPLNTYPKPPSPRMLSGLKFPVAAFSSWKLNWSSWCGGFFSEATASELGSSDEFLASSGTHISRLLAFK